MALATLPSRMRWDVSAADASARVSTSERDAWVAAALAVAFVAGLAVLSVSLLCVDAYYAGREDAIAECATTSQTADDCHDVRLPSVSARPR
jgi:hypothetical protein